MVVLIVEPLDPDVMQWLVARHAVRYAPDLARDPRALRQALHNVRALLGGALAVAAQLPEDQHRDWIERLIAQADGTLYAMAIGDAETAHG